MNFSFKKELEYIKRYRFKSVFFIYFKYIFFITAVPIVIIFLLTSIYYSFGVERDFKNNLTEKIKPVTTCAENILDEIDKCHYLLESNSNIYDFATTSFKDQPMMTQKLSSNIYDTLISYTSTGYYIENIHIYFPYIDYVLSNKESNSIKNYSEAEIFENIPDNIFRYFTTDEKNQLLRCVCTVTKNNSAIAVIVYEADMSFMLSLLSDETEVLILDGNNNTIYASSNKSYSDYLKAEYVLSNPNTLTSSDGTYLISTPISNGQYSLLYSYSAISETQKGFFALIVICVVLLSILLPLMIALYISSRFYKSIIELVSEFGHSDDDDSTKAGELEFLNTSILDIIKKNKIIESKLISNVKQLNESHLRTLQLQINPHFIFNTLNLANVIIMHELKRANDAEKVISHLSSLMAITLDTKNMIITVSDEISYVNEFIEIEKIRFKNNFDVFYDIEPEIYNQKIIKFTLQPIIENAFEYGIKPLGDIRGRIEIKAFAENNDIVFLITDNGHGIDAELVSNLNRSFLENNEPISHSHIGLHNVNKRIALLCGNPYGLNIKSSDGLTTVTIRYRL